VASYTWRNQTELVKIPAAIVGRQMITLLSIIALGFFLGMRHATDPDHVIAVTTIVSRQQSVRHAALIGILWGIGHTITILAVGSAIILFGIEIPPRLGLSMELSVGLMLILLGILNLSGIMRWITETFTPPGSENHPHSHAIENSAVGHSHGTPSERHALHAADAPESCMDRTFGRLGIYQVLRPLAVGLIHGLAGSAAVALLVLATIRVPSLAVLYLLIFGIGTIAGMMLITTAIAVPFKYSKTRFSRLNHSLGLVSGMISVAFGVFIVYEMAFVNGLFRHAPNWVPH
jgi:ABC-type nickel/cobalt efflux system permease component RcnA